MKSYRVSFLSAQLWQRSRDWGSWVTKSKPVPCIESLSDATYSPLIGQTCHLVWGVLGLKYGSLKYLWKTQGVWETKPFLKKCPFTIIIHGSNKVSEETTELFEWFSWWHKPFPQQESPLQRKLRGKINLPGQLKQNVTAGVVHWDP